MNEKINLEEVENAKLQKEPCEIPERRGATWDWESGKINAMCSKLQTVRPLEKQNLFRLPY